MDEIKFTQCAVAFLDILGFKNFIKAAEQPDTAEFRLFCDLLDAARRALHFTQSGDPETAARERHRFSADVGLKVIHVSDNFVLSAPLGNNPDFGYSGFVAVSMKAIQLAHQLLKMGFLIRGGIAVGNAYRTESNIFGTAHQSAFATEAECANMPRIIFHESAVKHFERSRHFGLELRGWSIFAQEGSTLMLDTLNAHWSYLSDDPSVDFTERFGSYKTVIERNLSKLQPGRDREKWEWMAMYFNAKTQHSSELRPADSIEIRKPSPFRFGPLINQPPTMFEETFRRFMAHARNDKKATD
jgi:hypothetical protein